jgi:predicted ATPase
VALAAITDPSLVLPAIAEALRVSEGAGQSLGAYLAGRQMLLVVDNVEQVVAAGPDLAGLLARAPGVRMLVTSREPLRVGIERVMPVEPMAGDDAVSLFAERAAAALPSFALTAQNRPIVGQICDRVDGLPLAIELAAARITVLSPEAMLGRLGDRLKLLTTGARDQPARHQTLRNTLAWSHDLLTDAERALFARLSVFAGSFALEAAEAVCDADLDAIAALVDRSLVRRDGDRYEMLAAIREYAAERLAEQPEAGAIHERHAAYFEALAERAYAERHRQQAAMADSLAADHDDLREALDWLSGTDPPRYARLAGLPGLVLARAFAFYGGPEPGGRWPRPLAGRWRRGPGAAAFGGDGARGLGRWLPPGTARLSERCAWRQPRTPTFASSASWGSPRSGLRSSIVKLPWRGRHSHPMRPTPPGRPAPRSRCRRHSTRPCGANPASGFRRRWAAPLLRLAGLASGSRRQRAERSALRRQQDWLPGP